MSPYSPFTPIASPLSQQPSHAVLLQKYRDLEAKIAVLEKEKATQQDAMNGKIHDLEVEVSCYLRERGDVGYER
jgi:hypothetical protein